MDPRRLLMLAALALALGGPVDADPRRPAAAAPAPKAAAACPATCAAKPAPPKATARPTPGPRAKPRRRSSHPAADRAAEMGSAAIASANRAARARSRSADFTGGLQVFAYAPGAIYEVWTAPLRVTTLSLPPGETVVAMAAGDTVRWQIGETTSGQGADQQVHVLVKPLERGLETNLVLTSTRRLYLLQLRSGAPEAANIAIAWPAAPTPAAVTPPPAETPGVPPVADVEAPPRGPPTSAIAPDAGTLDAGYAISPKGRRPAWTPTAVITDGVRSLITLPSTVGQGDAPSLFTLDAAGEAQMVNYRQQGTVLVVDQVIDEAELRLGDRRPQVVRITRLKEGRR